MTRVLALTSPGVGHMLPLVPSLWAARLAGANVLVGTTGAAVDSAATAGLPVVDLFPGGTETLATVRDSFVRRMPGLPPGKRFALAMELFAALADRVADEAVALGRRWRPDVIVHTPLQPAGPLVAAVLGVPCVEHGFQLTGVARTHHLLAPHMADACERHKVTAFREPEVALDVCPPSMHPGGPQGRLLGYRPYSGGRAVDPAVLVRHGGWPRLMITVGSTAEHNGLLPQLLETLSGRGIDLVVAGHLPHDMTVPADVVASGWLPLDPVLATCDGLVHHGGGGTALAALAFGVPQVIVSAHADHAFNAAALTRRGAGMSAIPEIDGDDALQSAVDHILHDPAPRRVAQAVAAEIAAAPGPDAVIPELLRELEPRRARRTA